MNHGADKQGMMIDTEIAIIGIRPCGLFQEFKLQRLCVDGACVKDVEAA